LVFGLGEVAALIEAEGFAVARRSAAGQPSDAEIWLGDSLGEMALYYALADAALLGGSFAPLGGQNLIEAAACGCPVVMGPHTFNFSEAAELALQAGAAQRVGAMAEGVRAAVELVRDPAARAAAVRASEGFAAAHRGAAEKTAREAELGRKLGERLKAAEQQIASAKSAALGNLTQVSGEVARAVIERLIGESVSPAEAERVTAAIARERG